MVSRSNVKRFDHRFVLLVALSRNMIPCYMQTIGAHGLAQGRGRSDAGSGIVPIWTPHSRLHLHKLIDLVDSNITISGPP